MSWMFVPPTPLKSDAPAPANHPANKSKLSFTVSAPASGRPVAPGPAPARRDVPGARAATAATAVAPAARPRHRTPPALLPPPPGGPDPRVRRPPPPADRTQQAKIEAADGAQNDRL